MTVISTIIGSRYTAHATDSLITQKQDNGTYKILDQKSPKLLIVRRWAGIMSYWGLSTKSDYGWSTLKWLTKQAAKSNKFSTLEDFAKNIRDSLNEELSKMVYKEIIKKGIGIHFTAHEKIDDYLIPELFAITNFLNTNYQELHSDGIHLTRETYGVAFQTDDRDPQYSQPKYRHEVREFLQENKFLIYNNGDPWMFNSAAASIGNMFEIAQQRKILRKLSNAKDYRDIVSWPIRSVSKMQKDFVISGHQQVGGKLHNLSVSSSGEYASDTGDA